MVSRKHRVVVSLLVYTIMCSIVFLLYTRSHCDSSGTRNEQHLAHVDHGTCPYAWLEEVASHATDSYLLEDTLLHKLQETSCAPSWTTTLDRILFLVMCSSDKKERMSWLSRTWLSWIPPRNVILLSDALIPGNTITVLPSLPRDAYLKGRFPSLRQTTMPPICTICYPCNG